MGKDLLFLAHFILLVPMVVSQPPTSQGLCLMLCGLPTRITLGLGPPQTQSPSHNHSFLMHNANTCFHRLSNIAVQTLSV